MGADDPKGYYSILGLALSAGVDDIRVAYRRRAMELHPDRNTSEDATQEFQLLTEAYGVLKDPDTRARYDATVLRAQAQAEAEAQAQATTHEAPRPIVCSRCGKISVQPRFAVFHEVRTRFFISRRRAVQGVFCSACADKQLLRATAITWLQGWWGLPLGSVYSLDALFRNLLGGERPRNINARLVAQQARYFARMGRTETARMIALDAMQIARHVRAPHESDGATVRSQMKHLLGSMGAVESGPRLKQSWGLLRRPFFVQALIGMVVVGFIGYAAVAMPRYVKPGWLRPRTAASTYSVSLAPVQPPGPENAVPPVQQPSKPAYVPPAVAPNGTPWPQQADYIEGYPRTNDGGRSKVTVDNLKSDSAVYAKLVSLDGTSAAPVRFFFIPAHGSFTMTDVTPGSYDVRYRDLATGRLARSARFTLVEATIFNGEDFEALSNDTTISVYRDSDQQPYDLEEDEF